MDQAIKIADFLLHHPNMPADKIPYWDYNAPNIPAALRDASAASNLSSALLELSGYVSGDRQREYFAVAEAILKNLSSDIYKAKAGNQWWLSAEGHLPNRSEVDLPLTYGDYYYVEAMWSYAAMR